MYSEKPFRQIRWLSQEASKILNFVLIWMLIQNFQFNFECIFSKNLNRWITYDLEHDLIFYCCHNPLFMPEGKVSV